MFSSCDKTKLPVDPLMAFVSAFWGKAVHMEGSDLLELLSLGGLRRRGFNLKLNICCALHSHFKNLVFGFKGDNKNINATISLSCVGSGPVLGGGVGPLLLRLLVQLHVRHQDVFLHLLRLVGVGAAVAGTFVGPPGANSPPTVQVDHADDQRHQQQARHHDDNKSGQVVAVR